MVLEEFDYSIHYDKLVDVTSQAALWGARRHVQQMSRWLPKNLDAKILEIGPGSGLALQLLTDAGCDVEAIEADKRLADRLVKRNLKVKFVSVEDTIDVLRQMPNSYDLIYAHYVLEHVQVKQQIDFVRAVSCALRPGGCFLCEVPNALSPVAAWYRYGDWTHTSTFTTLSLDFVLAAAGLDPDYVGRTLGPRSPSFGSPVKAVTEWLISGLLLRVSHLIQRIHLVAEFRTAGFKMPLTGCLLGVGRKKHA